VHRLLLLLTLIVAACADTQYFAPPAAESELRVNTRARSVMINEIGIPEYAINQEIPIEQADGSLTTDTDRLWADLPDRAMARSLTRHLNTITNAEVAVEPWPLSGFPDVEVSVRVEDMIVQADGRLRLTGSYALRREQGRGSIESFVVFAPVADSTYPVIIAAHEAAWLLLAEDIARNL